MMQAPSGRVQIPQLGLQQTWPASQTFLPHWTPPGPGMVGRLVETEAEVGSEVGSELE